MNIKKENAGVKVAINTLALYVKMLFTMFFSFFSVRFLLDALGVEEYGIFTLITGVVALLGFLNSAMTVSTQRYLSFYQGTDNVMMQCKTFYNSFLLHLCIGVLISLILLSITPYLFDGWLNINSDKLVSAQFLYYCVVSSVFFSIISVPFRALLNSHEDILIDSIVLFIQSLAKLSMSVLLLYCIKDNRLESFGLFLLLSNFLCFVFYFIFCMKRYKECQLSFLYSDRKLLVELGSFAGWNLYTNLCYVLNTQGINVVFNIFLGTTVNAAYGIAFQVNSQIKELSQSLLRAISPQIMKSEGMTNRDRTVRISLLASKFGFFLIAIISIPSIFVMPDILNLWLNTTPEYAVEFCSYFLIITLINQLTIGITPAIQAVGKIKKFQVTVGTIALFTLPISYVFLLSGYPPKSVFISMLIIEIITGVLKIVIFNNVCNFSKIDYLTSIVTRLISSLIILCMIIFYGLMLFSHKHEMLFSYLISFISYPVVFYFVSLSKKEQLVLVSLVKKITCSSKEKISYENCQ